MKKDRRATLDATGFLYFAKKRKHKGKKKEILKNRNLHKKEVLNVPLTITCNKRKIFTGFLFNNIV